MCFKSLLSEATICCIALLGSHGDAMLSHLSEASHPCRHATHTLPWYVTATVIHRVSLKPYTHFWRYVHLSLEAAESQTQLQACKATDVRLLTNES
jgi:hypothetical protein